MIPATCHPDRPHSAKGLCKTCYNRRKGRKIVPATCHPERPLVARGLCKSCYNREQNLVNKTPARVESQRKARKAWTKTHAGRIARMLYQAKTNGRGLPFNLGASDITIPSHCPVLGIPLDCAVERPSANLPSLDRIDNSKGYVKGNVWVISWRANVVKGNATHAELQALVRALDTRMGTTQQQGAST